MATQANSPQQSWYETLRKPSWAPQSSVFGKVWSVLYPIIFTVTIFVTYAYFYNQIALVTVVPFWLNIISNVLFAPLQFGLRNNIVALVDIIIVLGTIIWSMIAIAAIYPLCVLAYIPYLVWVLVATVLQAAIVQNNP